MLSQTKGNEEIKDENELYRRIHPEQIKHGKISSAAFKQKTPDLSVSIAKLTTPEKVLQKYPRHGLGSLVASIFRKENLEVYHAPVPCNYAHAIVYGKITESVAKRIADSARLICENLASLQSAKLHN
ncbi:MAG: hypothetical protein KKH04_22285 [Proteobacteria bacterium]|nr:hypothetical protein [Pseudomonadota bacterium]